MSEDSFNLKFTEGFPSAELETSSAREKAEKVAAPFGVHLGCEAVHIELIEGITTAIENAEVSGYVRGLRDGIEGGQEVLGYYKDLRLRDLRSGLTKGVKT